MIADDGWDGLLAGWYGTRVAAYLSRRRIECLERPEGQPCGEWCHLAHMCPALCQGYCIFQLGTIPEGVFELGKFFLVSRRIADTQVIDKLYPRSGEPTYEFKPTTVHVRMELARHCYREWEFAWKEFDDFMAGECDVDSNGDYDGPYDDWWFRGGPLGLFAM